MRGVRRLKPLCENGCGRRVKRHGRRFCSPQCVDLAGARMEGWAKGRRVAALRRQEQRFGGVVDRMVRDGRRISRGDILDALKEAYRFGYMNGWHCGRGQMGQQARAAAQEPAA